MIAAATHTVSRHPVLYPLVFVNRLKLLLSDCTVRASTQCCNLYCHIVFINKI